MAGAVAVNRAILLLGWGLAVAAILDRVALDWAEGGSDWRQGDWLINDGAGPVRRAPAGTALIALSDLTGLPLLALAVAVPLAALAVWLSALLLLAWRAGPGDRLLLMLLSPGLVLFWGSDPHGILRKELLVYLAFLPLVVTAARPSAGGGALIGSVVLYAAAAAAHEIAVFFAPAMVVAIRLCRPFDRRSAVAMAAVAGIAALALAYALRHAGLADAGPVCAPLVQRGLSPGICDGAIAWLARDMAFVRDRLVATLNQPGGWSVPLAYGLALLPFAVALCGSPRPGRGLLAILALGLPFLPLWLVAIDWGRWINAHVTVLAVLALILLRRRRPAWLVAPLPVRVKLPLLIAGLGVGFRHDGAVVIPGVVPVLHLWVPGP